MSNDKQILLYFSSLIVGMGGMLIHINLMVDTGKPVHLVCTILWMVIVVCSVIILKKTENGN